MLLGFSAEGRHSWENTDDLGNKSLAVADGNLRDAPTVSKSDTFSWRLDIGCQLLYFCIH